MGVRDGGQHTFSRPQRFRGAAGHPVEHSAEGSAGDLAVGELDFASFCTGQTGIDDWVHERASSCTAAGTAVLYYSLADGGKLAGLYTLSAYSVERQSVKGGWLQRNTPRQIPVVLLGILGVDQDFQGQGLGWRLLQDALRRALSVSEHLGARALLVEPYNETARSFYEHFGFQVVPGSSTYYARLH
ncbi:hypothetical protein KIM372_00680 [Bombiscardovia nodaiensis]|uniref:N-acetyltransferase domain-containing protein n=1 Tax=Bombiscardovia nodaiensis TaxID=2932181 RepID=A0ABM8B618_9BIFI|nr:hypothetical protein KIM372_00680 [Bombiscardovia nodaiensis]